MNGRPLSWVASAVLLVAPLLVEVLVRFLLVADDEKAAERSSR